MKRTSEIRGFTLLEVLVAIAIFGLFSVMAYGGLMQLLDSQERLTQEQRFWNTLSRNMRTIADDLAHVRARPVRDIDGQSLSAFIGRPTDTRALAPPAMEFTRGGLFVLDDAARSDLQRIGYRLNEGRLLRVIWPVLDRAPVTKPLEVALLEGVDEFRLRFFSANGSWVEQWPPANSPEVMPSGVELTLALRNRGSFRRIFLING